MHLNTYMVLEQDGVCCHTTKKVSIWPQNALDSNVVVVVPSVDAIADYCCPEGFISLCIMYFMGKRTST